ncbi:MAG TPA: SdpI family protein [Actinomycetota bacterium]|nr:SdpI family protein [Actinomycetota bacterium]
MDAQGLPLVAAGIVLIFAALRGRVGRLPRNGLLGIRLPSTMRSDAAWDAAHRASWLATFLAGFVALGGGLALTLAAVEGSVAVPSTTSSILILLLIGTIQADRAARNR